ncbi:MAG: porin [Alphaproteobacteria bacterium]|nr:porin [Alphaproteobacteria bacterium]
MIRYLLGSTALLGVVVFGASVNAATNTPTPTMATPQFKISGQTSFNSWFFRNKSIYLPGDEKNLPCKRQTYGRGQLFTMDDARLKFNVDGKTDRGMEYGLVFTLDAGSFAERNVREDYLYFGGSWGRLYIGDTYGVEDTMAFGGFDQLGGTGGFNGDFDRVVNFTTGAPRSVNLVGETSRDTKFTYLTPRWNGIQIGASYTPRMEHRGEMEINSATSVLPKKKPFGTDNIASGINFIHKFASGFEMALSGTSIFAEAHPEFKTSKAKEVRGRKNIASFAFGGRFTYQNFGFSAEYGNNGKSLEFKGQNKSNAGQFVDFGLSYIWGATKFSTGYYYGWRNALGAHNKDDLFSNYKRVKAHTNIVTAAIDQKLAPGLGVYLEYAYYDMHNKAAKIEAKRRNDNVGDCGGFIGGVPTNKANAFVIGSRLVF